LATLLRHPTLIASDTLFELTDGGRAQGSKAALAALTAHDNHAELDSISEQTLIIHGRNDMLIRCEDSEQLASRLPTAELVIFEDTGHMPMLERPVPFNDELLRFADGEAQPA
jgi:pimeloyl-ACP methyl ester carboxylesterase